MSVKKKAVTSFASVSLDGIFKYIDKDPERNLVKLLEGKGGIAHHGRVGVGG